MWIAAEEGSESKLGLTALLFTSLNHEIVPSFSLKFIDLPWSMDPLAWSYTVEVEELLSIRIPPKRIKVGSVFSISSEATFLTMSVTFELFKTRPDRLQNDGVTYPDL